MKAPPNQITGPNVRDGRIFARVLAHTAPESLIEQHTRGLLDDNAA